MTQGRYGFMRFVVAAFAVMSTHHAMAEDTSQVVRYRMPMAASGAPDYVVRVNGTPISVYNTQVAACAIFSFSGEIKVTVTPLAAVESVALRPLSYGIKPMQEDNTISFGLTEPCQLSLEVNGSTRHPLFLFANPLETDVPKPDDPGVRFYKGGQIHNVGLVTLKDNDTVYIQGGAIVRGAFLAQDAKNVNIMGRGILDGSGYGKGKQRMAQFARCEDLHLQGITIVNSGHWTVVLDRSKDVSINNLKIINWRDWDDGIDICGSRDVLVRDCFIRTKDDCIAVKSVNYQWDGFDVNSVDHESRDIVITDSVLWNGIWGNAFEIGFETRTETIRDIVFKNNDIIHVQGSEGTLSIHNGDRARVSNVLYEDIRIERVQGILFDLKILHSRYTKDTEPGHIMNILFKDIKVSGDRFPPSIIQGFDETHRIQDVQFENVTIQGKPIKSLKDGRFKNSHSDNITFR